MGDNQEEGQPYKITVTNPDGTKSDLPHSYGFTGEGTAVYPNNEIYEGSYENGVSYFFSLNFPSKETEREHIPTSSVTNTKETGRQIKSMA